MFMQLELPLERESSSGGSSPQGAASSPGAASPPARHPADLYAGGDTHQRMNFPNLHRSRTITGAPSKLPRRPPGLPPSDTGPLGDNIYSWLQSSSPGTAARTDVEVEERVQGKPGDQAAFHKDFVNIRCKVNGGKRYNPNVRVGKADQMAKTCQHYISSDLVTRNM